MLFSKLPLQALLLLSTSVIAEGAVITDPPLNLTKTHPNPPDLISYVGKPEFHKTERASKSLSEAEYAALAYLPPPSVTSDQLESLRLHNVARAQKRLKALVWDYTLESNARDWATYIAGINNMQHSNITQRPGQGENLAYAKSSQPILDPATIGTQQWLAEIVNYHGEPIPQGNFEGYGHYTQCVWSTSYKVGVATVRSADGAYYTVGRYSPAGNIQGLTPFGAPINPA